MRVIRASEHRVMPWKNGQGSTTEIAVCPEGAGLGAFDWRVSMATVSIDGPFSLFDGIDRTLTVLRGAGIRLSVGDRPTVELTPTSAPHAFPGDDPASAALLGGEIIDLNVMSRRSSLRHSVRRIEVDGEIDLEIAAPWTLLFCASGEVEATGERVKLGLHDALLVERAKPASWTLTGSPQSTVFSIAFFEVGRG